MWHGRLFRPSGHRRGYPLQPLWVDFRDAADAAGLRACWSTPIRSPKGCVLGTFAVYFHQPRGPLRRDLRTAAHMATLAAVAIGRRRAEDALLEARDGRKTPTPPRPPSLPA
ncbi:GAF domain-containing protein [Tistrella bauzanensis]